MYYLFMRDTNFYKKKYNLPFNYARVKFSLYWFYYLLVSLDYLKNNLYLYIWRFEVIKTAISSKYIKIY